jgi:hypothetical protein
MVGKGVLASVSSADIESGRKRGDEGLNDVAAGFAVDVGVGPPALLTVYGKMFIRENNTEKATDVTVCQLLSMRE